MGARTDEERANARVGSSPPFAMPPAAASEDGQKLDFYPLWSFRELVVQFVHRALVGLPRRRLGGGQLQDANESSPEERRPQAGRKPRSVTGWGRGQKGYSGAPGVICSRLDNVDAHHVIRRRRLLVGAAGLLPLAVASGFALLALVITRSRGSRRPASTSPAPCRSRSTVSYSAALRRCRRWPPTREQLAMAREVAARQPPSARWPRAPTGAKPSCTTRAAAR
jgi:hypothetical protein